MKSQDEPMSEYLWDGSGEPEPEVQRLEALLSPLAYDAPLKVDDVVDLDARRARRARLMTYAAAAVVLLGIGVGVWLWRKPKPGEQLVVVPTDGAAAMCVSDDPSASWSVATVAGTPSCAGAGLDSKSRVAVGQWIETDNDSVASIEVADIGRIVVDPGSRVGLVATTREEHRMRLEHGTIHASVNAPPRLFVVETPSATAVDLGCEYTLRVDPSGDGQLHVTFGYVALERDGREVFVPENAVCDIRAGVGPGIPYSDTASLALRAALARLDADDGAVGSNLDIVIAEARAIDTISLWHLIPRVATGPLRQRIYDKMIELSPPPDDAKRDALLDADAAALELWRSDMQDLWLQGFEGPVEFE